MKTIHDSECPCEDCQTAWGDQTAPAMAAANLKALGEGANARRADRSRDTNPYPWWRSEHREWHEGWDWSDRIEHAGTEPA